MVTFAAKSCSTRNLSVAPVHVASECSLHFLNCLLSGFTNRALKAVMQSLPMRYDNKMDALAQWESGRLGPSCFFKNSQLLASYHSRIQLHA